MGGRMQAVYRLGGDVDGRMEAERHVGTPDVVVDGLRQADDWTGLPGQQVGCRIGAVAAEHDQGVEPEPCDRFLDQLRLVLCRPQRRRCCRRPVP